MARWSQRWGAAAPRARPADAGIYASTTSTRRGAAGAVDRILRQLEAFGLLWDGAPLFQSTRGDAYLAALDRLRASGAVYRCTCTRKEVMALAQRGVLGPIYPGTCRAGLNHPDREPAWRQRLPPGSLRFTDAVHGDYRLHAALEIGDPVLRRRDGTWGYHLATTVDDAALGVTDVVRGADLLPAAVIQATLQPRLDLPQLRWAHMPVARTPTGHKLSKQNGAPALNPSNPLPALLGAWRVLGQVEPPDVPSRVSEFHAWARAHWSLARVPADARPGAIDHPHTA